MIHSRLQRKVTLSSCGKLKRRHFSRMSEPFKLTVLHRSDNFLAVDKNYDLVMNDNDPDRFSLAHLLKRELPDLYNHNFAHGFQIIHRLDFSTSGIVIFPLTHLACTQGAKAFESRKAKKYYIAVVRGHITDNYIKVNMAIGIDSRPDVCKIKMAPEGSQFCKKARTAETHIVVLSRGFYDGDPVTKILLKPLTGRRHQLRIHCREIGHTILGDFTYSDRSDVKPYRMFLHAHRLVLPNAVEPLDLVSNDPFFKKDQDLYRETEQVHSLNLDSFSIFENKNVVWTSKP